MASDNETHEARWNRLGWSVEWDNGSKLYLIWPRGWSIKTVAQATKKPHPGVLPEPLLAYDIEGVDKVIGEFIAMNTPHRPEELPTKRFVVSEIEASDVQCGPECNFLKHGNYCRRYEAPVFESRSRLMACREDENRGKDV